LCVGIGWQIVSIELLAQRAIAESITPDRKLDSDIEQTETTSPAEKLDLPPEILENSPVLQKWLRGVPNVLEDIRHDPSFRTRLRLGFSWFPSTDDAAGINFGIEDLFIDRTGLTISADYQTSFNGDRLATGADLHYFLFPLGGYVNFAPLVGYRYVQSNDFNTDGVNLGVRLMLALSRTGAADLSVSQSFISPGGNNEVGLTSLSVGYAVTSNLRLSTDLELQNSREDKDNRVGINLEWLL
jgi:hypothetical protein